MKPLLEIAKSALMSYRIATSSLRLLPDFIIIGTARSGTTSLYNYLVEHPDVAPALRKEVHYFDNNYQRGPAWYRGQFPTLSFKSYTRTVRKRAMLTGEASPYYIFHPYAAQRIAAFLPQVKLIVLLRNPVERAFSHYCWEVGWGNEKLSFEEAIACEDERIQIGADKLVTGSSFHHQHFSYISRSKYAQQLEHWFIFFPREQFLILKSEDMYQHPAAIFQQTLDFLQLPAYNCESDTKEFKQYNRQRLATPAPMLPETRKRLVELFEPENERLYQLLDRDFGWT
jgi:hypothetical protein